MPENPARASQRRADRIAAGLCRRCGIPREPSHITLTLCITCHASATRSRTEPTQRYARTCALASCARPFSTTNSRRRYCHGGCQDQARRERELARYHRTKASKPPRNRWRRGRPREMHDFTTAQIERLIAQAEAQQRYERRLGLRPGVEAIAWSRTYDPVSAESSALETRTSSLGGRSQRKPLTGLGL